MYASRTSVTSPTPGTKSVDNQLVLSCYNGDFLAATAVIADGASVNNQGWLSTQARGDLPTGFLTPLAAAAWGCHRALVVHLLSLGANVNGDSVMWISVQRATPDILEVMVAAGGDVNGGRGLRSESPLFGALIGTGDVEGRVRFLLAQPDLNILAMNSKSQTAEQCAAEEKKASIATIIRKEVHCELGKIMCRLPVPGMPI